MKEVTVWTEHPEGGEVEMTFEVSPREPATRMSPEWEAEALCVAATWHRPDGATVELAAPEDFGAEYADRALDLAAEADVAAYERWCERDRY